MIRLAGTRLVSLLRGSEAARLTAAVIVAAGSVALAESLAGSHHGSHGSSSHYGPPPLADAAKGQGGSLDRGRGTTGLPGGNGSDPHSLSSAAKAVNGSQSAAAAAVASSPAVSRALRSGEMTVVIDQPPAGLFSEQNRSIARGAAVGVDELNAGGGLRRRIHVKLVRQNLDGLSADVLRKRLLSEGAAALILPCDTDSQLGLASAAAHFGMLMLAPCNPDPQAGRSFPTYWPVGTAASDETLELASFMRVVGYGSVFVIDSTGSRYVELLTGYFRAAAQAKHIQLAGSAPIALNTRNFSSLARRIEAARPRPAAIFTALPPPVVNRLAAGLAGQGLPQVVMGTAAMDTQLTLASGGESLNNAVLASLGFPRESAAARRFAADYRRRFHTDPIGSFPAAGLETIRLLEDAVRKAGSAQPSAIQRALVGGIKLRGVGLADRVYQPGGDHNPIGEVAVAKIASNSFLPLYAGMPSGAPRS
jgi:branched-chain amino acid transport system substrate-binding protein